MINVWKGYPNFWSDFEHKDLVEIIWNNYKESIDSTLNSLRETDDSKSILTVPARLKQVWKAISFSSSEPSFRFTGDRVVEIPQLLNENFEVANIRYEIDSDKNEIKLLNPSVSSLGTQQPENHWTLRLWAPVVYTENPAVWKFFAPLLNIPELEHMMEKHGIKNYSEEYYRTIRSLWYIFVNGPTLKNIEVGLLILFNIPHVIERSKVTDKKTSGQSETITTEVIATGRIENHTYDYTVFISNYQIGDIVPEKSSLVSGGAEVHDYITKPNWWEDLPPGQTRTKLELIEKYCTYLIRINSSLISMSSQEGLDLPPVLNSFLRKISPSFVKYLVVTFFLHHDELKLEDIDDELEFDFRNGPSFCDAVFDDKLDNVLVLKGEAITSSFTTNANGVISNFPKGAYIIKLDNESVNVVQYTKRDLILNMPTTVRITYKLVDFTDEIYVGHAKTTLGKEAGVNNPFPSLKKHPKAFGMFPALTSNEDFVTTLEAIIDMRNAIELEWVESYGERLVEGDDYTTQYIRENIGEGYIRVLFKKEVQSFVYGLLVAPRICGILEGSTHPYPSLEKFPSHKLLPRVGGNRRRFEDHLTIKGRYDPKTYRHAWPSLVKYPSIHLKPMEGG